MAKKQRPVPLPIYELYLSCPRKERRLELDGKKQRPVPLPIYELYLSVILCLQVQKNTLILQIWQARNRTVCMIMPWWTWTIVPPWSVGTQLVLLCVPSDSSSMQVQKSSSALGITIDTRLGSAPLLVSKWRRHTTHYRIRRYHLGFHHQKSSDAEIKVLYHFSLHTVQAGYQMITIRHSLDSQTQWNNWNK